jgi:hypothetical protein
VAEPTVPPRDQRTEPIEPIEPVADHGPVPAAPAGEPSADRSGRPARRGPDLLTLAAGLITLAVAVMALTGRVPHIALFDLRWVLAGGAILLGLALLSASVGGKGRARRPGPRASGDRPGADR